MRKLTSLSICSLLLPMILFAQTTGKVSGVVSGDDGSALPGANVVVVGTSMGEQPMKAETL